MSAALGTALARLARSQREAADALEALAAALATTKGDPSELVPHTRWPFSRRVACKLARSGAIKAKRSGKSWIATRAELDRYLAACPSAERVEPLADAAPVSVASILASVRGRRAA